MNSQTTTITIVRLRVWYEKIDPMTTKFLRAKKTREIPNLQNEMDGVIAIVFPHHQKVFIDFTDFFYREIVISIFFRSGSKLLRNVILMIGYYSVNGVCSCCCCGIIFLIVKKFFVDIWSFVVEKERKITTATFDLVQIFREIATPHFGVM